jgi:hypothetical protein
MKSNELRIGSWIRYKQKDYKVESIKLESISIKINNKYFDIPLDDIEPIKIDESQLEKFGFKPDGFTYVSKDNSLYIDGTVIHYSFNNWRNMGKLDEYTEIVAEIIYIHQLQNLYYSIHLKELESIEPITEMFDF